MFYLQNLTNGEVKTVKTVGEAYQIVSEWHEKNHDIELYFVK